MFKNCFIIILFFSFFAFGCTNKAAYQKPPKDIIWFFPPTDFNKRMFHGPVKKSTEVMFYAKRDAQGEIVKSEKKYYKTGFIFPHNFSIEFDSIGRRKRFVTYTGKAGRSSRGGPINEDRYGLIYNYDKNGKELGHKTINKRDGRDWHSTSGEEKHYDKKGNEDYNIVYHCDIDGTNKITRVRSVFKYNSKGLMIDSELYTREMNEDPLIQERSFGEEPITYEYDDQGKVIKKKREKGETNHYYYKNDTLYRETKELFGRTNEYIYYPNGVYKSAKFRTTLVTGDFEFLETGDITKYNDQKVAEYSEYDKYGNWTKRIRYKENGDPESYTDREIEYFK